MPVSHIDSKNRPTMVDVTDKNVTPRHARAQAIVNFPADVFNELQTQQLVAKKGPIVDTAIIAGVMAAKRTHELIPFCHPLPLESCKISIEPDLGLHALVITSDVKVTHKTGVEMEALTAASVTALTVYDMCKALSHDIVISDTRLLQKRGGKSDIG